MAEVSRLGADVNDGRGLIDPCELNVLTQQPKRRRQSSTTQGTTLAGEPVTVDPEESVEVTTIEPGTYVTVPYDGGSKATQYLRHDGDWSAYTFLVNECVTFVVSEGDKNWIIRSQSLSPSSSPVEKLSAVVSTVNSSLRLTGLSLSDATPA